MLWGGIIRFPGARTPGQQEKTGETINKGMGKLGEAKKKSSPDKSRVTQEEEFAAQETPQASE